MKIRVMTYNIAGGRCFEVAEKQQVKPEACAAVIAEYVPDICGLNEVDFHLPRSGRIDLAADIGKIVGMKSVFARAVTWGEGDYGNGFLSRLPIIGYEDIIVPDPTDKSEPTYYETRCILRLTVDFGGREADVIVTHFGLAKTERDESIKILTSLIDGRTRPLILMGDFNIEPDDPQLAPIYQRLHDTFAVYPEKFKRTYPSRNDLPRLSDVCRERGLKIDYIFVSDEFKVDKVTIPETIASDHVPYIADVEL